MTTAVINPSQEGNLRNTIFDYNKIVFDLNESKPFVLQNGQPTVLMSPYSLMPRNYLSENNVCTIRYAPETSYPSEILIMGEREIKMFPPFTPIGATPTIQYQFDMYDRTEAFVHNHAQNDNGLPPQPNRSLQTNEPQIPQARDYYNMIEPDRNVQYQPLGLSFPLGHGTANPQQSAAAAAEPPSICSETRRKQIRFAFADTPEQFFAPPDSTRPSVALPIPEVVQNYFQLLRSQRNQGPSMAPSNAAGGDAGYDATSQQRLFQPQPQQQQQQQQQPKPAGAQGDGYGVAGDVEMADSTTYPFMPFEAEP